MTRQYVIGQLSLILGALQDAATNEAAGRDVRDLRREVETGPFKALPSLAVRALELADAWCWESLMHGESRTFESQAAISGELWEFAVCACLLEDR